MTEAELEELIRYCKKNQISDPSAIYKEMEKRGQIPRDEREFYRLVGIIHDAA